MPSCDGLDWPVAKGTARALTTARVTINKVIFILVLQDHSSNPVAKASQPKVFAEIGLFF
jgi:hypothetical protein